MGIDLYYMPLSAPCRSIMLGAKALGLELNLKLTDLMAGDHMKPEFIAINPQHNIPTVDDNGFHMNESRAILAYFVNQYAKNDSLYPKEPKQRFIVDQRLAFDMGTLYHRFGEVYYPAILEKKKIDPAKVTRFNEALGWVEAWLSKTKYIAGDNLTIADFAVITTLSTVEAVGHDLSAYPNLNKYMSQLKSELAGYEELNQQGADQFGQWAKAAFKEIEGA